jgi:hypothetical protein
VCGVYRARCLSFLFVFFFFARSRSSWRYIPSFLFFSVRLGFGLDGTGRRRWMDGMIDCPRVGLSVLIKALARRAGCFLACFLAAAFSLFALQNFDTAAFWLLVLRIELRNEPLFSRLSIYIRVNTRLSSSMLVAFLVLFLLYYLWSISWWDVRPSHFSQWLICD